MARRKTLGKLIRNGRPVEDVPDEDKIFTIHKQDVFLSHPHNEDSGWVSMEIQVMPKMLADTKKYLAATGPDAWKLSDENQVLVPACVRPESSFPWYRLDKQIMWRCKYFCKKTWGWWLLALVIVIGNVSLI